jgi:hypothetical protein
MVGAMGRLLSTISTGFAAVGILAMGMATADAQEQSRRGGVVLHEYFEPSRVPASASDGSAAGPGATSTPSRRSPNAGGPPGLTLNPQPGDLILGPDGPVDGAARRPPYGPRSPRSGSSKLDDKTSRVDNLDYHSAFDPSVFPYKRNVSQSRVVEEGGDYRITNDSERMERLSIASGGASANEDTFWGTFLIDAEAGTFHPIPSVSPDQRFLQVETEPEAGVEFFRDGADNHYVRLQQEGLVRINAKIAAPRFYFAGRLEGDPGWQAFADREMPPLSDDVRSVARDVVRHIGVSSEMSPKVVLERMIRHYRDFETKQLPDEYNSGDLYTAISKQQIGVCRHRSLAFVVTAQAFGIPARYITNEAHAFVEVYWPPAGWRRIDLGGAAREIGYQGGRNDTLHDASDDDPFPQPESYREEMRRMRGQNSGSDKGTTSAGNDPAGSDGKDAGDAGISSDRTRSGRREESPSDEKSASESSSPENRSPKPDAGEPEPSPEQTADQQSASEDVSNRNFQRADARQRDGSQSSPEQTGRATRLSFQADAREVFRGSDLTVYGRLYTVDNEPVANRTVEVRFGRVGAAPENMETIGSVEADADGRFRSTVKVPETTGIGRWSIVAVFPGDERFGRATAK